MFGRSKRSGHKSNEVASQKEPVTWDIPIFFGILFLLSIPELYFTVDCFQYLERSHEWEDSTERARLAFLIFSSLRTIALSAVYMRFHVAGKYLHSAFHIIFLVLSTILWIVSAVLIHQMWGLIHCGGIGVLEGGLSECHKLKIIEIFAWIIAGVSVLATIPVLMLAMKRRKRNAGAWKKTSQSG